MEVITRYKCTVCGTEWETQAMAQACEAYQLPPCPVAVGQRVKVYERYDDPEDDEVTGVRVAPSFMVWSLATWEEHGESGAKMLLDRHPSAQFHEWLVHVKKLHLMNKDGDMADEVSLHNIMVDGSWLDSRAAA